MRLKKKKKQEEMPAENSSQRNEKQLKWVLIWMGIVIVSIVIIFLVYDSLKRFEYGGLKFERIIYDKLPLYYSRIPIKTAAGEIVGYYNLYLRNDPRKLSIPINGTIKLMRNSMLSIDQSMEGCSDNGVAGVTLGTFFKAAGINIEYASTNRSIAKERNISYATCEDSSKQTVIVIRQTDKTEIVQEKKDCYSINFKDCEIIKAVERFIVATSAHSTGISI